MEPLKPLSTSPVPEKEIKFEMMTLPQALNKVLDERKITRIEWQNTDIYVVLKETLKIFRGDTDKKLYDWVIGLEDITAIDWVVIEESN